MTLPDYFGLGMKREHALLIRDMLAENASICEKCAAALEHIEAQIKLLSGELPPRQPGCSNC
jgi:hypothetical protein